MNVVSNEQVSNEHGLRWSGLKWMVSNEWSQLSAHPAFIPVLNTFKITTFPHLVHRSNITEYSFYNCIRYRNAKTRQSICSN